MDLLANDIIVILSLITALLGLFKDLLPFFKKPKDIPLGNIFEKKVRNITKVILKTLDIENKKNFLEACL